MRNLRVLVSVAAVANYGVVVWHTYLAGKVNPALPAGEAVRVLITSGTLTLAGLALLWTQRQKIGSLVLMAGFVIGLVIGSTEHFFVAGPNNVFDVANGDWALPFKISVWILLVVQVAGVSAAGRMLAGRFSGEVPGSPSVSR
jgi:hypothetical protein